jgi:hypothetical protein
VIVVDDGRVADIRDVDYVDAIAPTPVPRMIPITRTARQPTIPRIAAESEAEADTPATASESEEGDVRRGPDGIVVGIVVDGTRPPDPVPAVDEPPAIVIRRPAPRLIGDPRPAIVGFIDPPAISIRCPARPRRGNPHRTIIRDLGPAAISIEIFRSCVIAIGLAPALGAVDSAITVIVPGIPVVFSRGRSSLVFRVVGASDGNHLAFINMGVALRR